MKNISLIDKLGNIQYNFPNKENSSIGRGGDDDVVICDCPLTDTVSRNHCTITHNYEDETFFVFDNDSKYGTYLNGRKLGAGKKIENGNQLRDIMHLGNGDKLKLGDYKLEVMIKEIPSPDLFEAWEGEIDGEYDMERLRGEM